jgi:para-aminobenzoate synthetase / 4-amino-4-deoxychorismate lyase
MQIIAELESTPRQIYTGTIGYYAPGRSAQFNVAIRTLLIDAQHQQATYGVGGGIVWDSDPAEEWAETITKARILHEPPQPFHLLETMRWSPGEGWFLLEQHIARLHASAEYFAFPLDLHALRHKLAQAAEGFQDTARRVRLLLARDGTIHLEAQPLSTSAAS